MKIYRSLVSVLICSLIIFYIPSVIQIAEAGSTTFNVKKIIFEGSESLQQLEYRRLKAQGRTTSKHSMFEASEALHHMKTQCLKARRACSN